MKRKLILLFLLCCHGVVHAADEGLEKFSGEWEVELVKDPSFPYWNHIPYPTRLVVSRDKSGLKILYQDNRGSKCEPVSESYREDMDIVMFDHCMVTHFDSVITSHYYRIKVEEENLEGETWNYKRLFRWKGKRVQSAPGVRGPKR